MMKGAARIIQKIRFRAVAATMQTMIKASDKLIAQIQNAISFENVTGNAFTSISAGVYYKGVLVHVSTVAQNNEEPTRKSLRKGERYNLPYFYGEMPGAYLSDYEAKKHHYFKGTHGSGGQWGPTAGTWFLKRQHPAKSKTWEIIVAIPMSYAGYVSGIIKTMQTAMDMLPSCVTSSIVRVESSPELEGKLLPQEVSKLRENIGRLQDWYGARGLDMAGNSIE